MIVVIAGGVGAARFLRGLVQIVDPSEITVVVNTGDDTVFHGLHVSPDIDTVTYTVAGAIDPERGWGLAGESWRAMEALKRYENFSALTWFNLGDRDLATHLWRTSRLRDGATLTEVTAELAKAWNLGFTMLPMSNDPVSTFVESEIGTLAFQEYFVKHQHGVAISGVEFRGIETATAAPGVIAAISTADHVIIAPSNPLVSIGPVLAVKGIRDALILQRSKVVAISPIVAGEALKGPADRMLTELGHEASVVGVARLYREFASTLIIDDADNASANAVSTEGINCVVTDTIMSKTGVTKALAQQCLDAVQ
jgi:LPPG:FO 2-phospho-L-lactate transferase